MVSSSLRLDNDLKCDHCLPMSNVETMLSLPNSDGIGPDKALPPDDTKINLMQDLSRIPNRIINK